jgi:hypothetical protein
MRKGKVQNIEILNETEAKRNMQRVLKAEEADAADAAFMPADQKSLPASPAISNPRAIEPRMPSSNPYLQRKPVPLPTVPAAKLGDQEERLNSYLELLKN